MSHNLGNNVPYGKGKDTRGPHFRWVSARKFITTGQELCIAEIMVSIFNIELRGYSINVGLLKRILAIYKFDHYRSQYLPLHSNDIRCPYIRQAFPGARLDLKGRLL